LNGYGEISGYLWKGFVDGNFECEFYILIRVDTSPEFNIILKTWSDIMSEQPMFWSDMTRHSIFLKRDRSVVTVL
jgi:hypothetical protein